eukprot:scaffold81858_cov33-Prasinocladus_malaysianus.AAC.1
MCRLSGPVSSTAPACLGSELPSSPATSVQGMALADSALNSIVGAGTSVKSNDALTGCSGVSRSPDTVGVPVLGASGDTVTELSGSRGGELVHSAGEQSI